MKHRTQLLNWYRNANPHFPPPTAHYLWRWLFKPALWVFFLKNKRSCVCGTYTYNISLNVGGTEPLKLHSSLSRWKAFREWLHQPFLIRLPGRGTFRSNLRFPTAFPLPPFRSFVCAVTGLIHCGTCVYVLGVYVCLPLVVWLFLVFLQPSHFNSAVEPEWWLRMTTWLNLTLVWMKIWCSFVVLMPAGMTRRQ